MNKISENKDIELYKFIITHTQQLTQKWLETRATISNSFYLKENKEIC